ncbi:L-galactonate dehydratase like protein [Verticillium longisporum]|nr:L-galactonate dehydratase like protein [Verticillium longisporum]
MDQSYGLVSYDPYIEAEHLALKLDSARHNRDDHRTRPRLATPSTMFPSSFVDRWSRSIQTRRDEQLHDFPNYHLSNPEELVTTSTPQSITVGSGVFIYKQTLLPAILTARHEVILVTCFWAESDTLRALRETLHELAKRRRETIASDTDSSSLPRLRIRIGFSSRSFFQKIFHPWSRDGHAYPPSAWAKLEDKMKGLLQETLSKGYRHFKLKVGSNVEQDKKRLTIARDVIGYDKGNILMVDANQVWSVPEAIAYMKELKEFKPWFIEEPTSPDDILGHKAIDACRMGGVNEVLAVLLMAKKFNVPIVPHSGGVGLPEYTQHLSTIDYVVVSGKLSVLDWEVWFEGCVEFTGPAVEQLLRFYASVWDGNVRQVADWDDSRTRDAQSIPPIEPTRNEPDSACQKRLLDPTPTPTMILPSSHHVNPSFRYIPFLGRLTSPATPLNAALLDLFASAQTQIDIITPNLTCRAVVDALLASLARGVNVRIRTSRNMMLIEQLVTACTTTEWTIRSLINRYEALTASWTSRAFDMEAQRQRPGRLEIYYYRPATKSPDEPVVSHLKMTLVDREYLMLGSGNLDRASWYTSQELGILLHVPGFEHDIWSAVLNTRMDVRYRPE